MKNTNEVEANNTITILDENYTYEMKQVKIEELSITHYEDRSVDLDSPHFKGHMQSIELQGILEPPTCDENGVLISGRHRYGAVKKLMEMHKWKHGETILCRVVKFSLDVDHEIKVMSILAQFNKRAKDSKDESKDNHDRILKFLANDLSVNEICSIEKCTPSLVYRIKGVRENDQLLDLLNKGKISLKKCEVLASIYKASEIPKKELEVALNAGSVEQVREDLKKYTITRRIKEAETRGDTFVFEPKAKFNKDRFEEMLKKSKDSNDEKTEVILGYICELDEDSLAVQREKFNEMVDKNLDNIEKQKNLLAKCTEKEKNGQKTIVIKN